MRVPLTASVSLLLAVASWSLALVLDPRMSESAAVLTGAGLWINAAVAVTGILVVRGIWARRLALAVIGAAGVVAVTLDPGVAWWVSLGLSGVAAVAIAGPWMDPHIRGLRGASGPPIRTMMIPLTLLWAPYLVGITGGEGWSAVIVGASGPLAAFWFARALPGALIVARLLWPALAVGLAWPMGVPEGVVAVILAAALAGVAWHRSVTTSIHPLVERGTRVRIPPELAPGEVLDAARRDDRGRHR